MKEYFCLISVLTIGLKLSLTRLARNIFSKKQCFKIYGKT